jgi:hypothetical protein
MIGQGLFIFMMLVLSFQINADSNTKLVKNLEERFSSLSSGSALIKSYPHHSQSYIYDQALAIIAFSKAKKKNKAQELLRGLEKLQLQDGSLYFSYYLDGTSPYPIEGDKRFAGAIAWVAIAATHFQAAFNSKEFKPFNEKILNYLQTQVHKISINDQSVWAVAFAPSDIKGTPWNENKVAALEHNLDVYRAFVNFQMINHERSEEFKPLIQSVGEFILVLWDTDRQHFWSGANIENGLINKEELYLDNQSWSLLAMDEALLKKINPHKALQFNCKNFLVQDGEIEGFMDSRPTNRPSRYQFVWSEGSAGQILAMKKTQPHFSCSSKKDGDFLKEVKKMMTSDGGIAYASSAENPDFTTSSSVAGTTWFYFATNNINPFQP